MSGSARIAGTIVVALVAAVFCARLAAPAGAQEPYTRDYSVKKGDTLVSIAGLHGVTVQAILQANGLGRAQLYPGQRLTIPRAGRRAQAGYPDALRGCGDSAYYMVRRGDTLPGIAGDNDMSLGQLKQMNDLQTEVIWVGQVLWLPCNPGERVAPQPPAAREACGPDYVVRVDEQLADIAEKCGIAPSDLLAANGLVTSTLLAGQYLVIPQTVHSSVDPPPSSEP